MLCPSPILRGGHSVRTIDGSFVHTEALVKVADTVELHAYEPYKPSTRLRGKQSPTRAAVVHAAFPDVAVSRRGGEGLEELEGLQAGSERRCNFSVSGVPFFVPQTGFGGEGQIPAQPTCLPQGSLAGILSKHKSRRQSKQVRFELPPLLCSEEETFAVGDEICSQRTMEVSTLNEGRKFAKKEKVSPSRPTFPLSYGSTSSFRAPAVRTMALRSDGSGLPCLPAYECVGTSHALSR